MAKKKKSVSTSNTSITTTSLPSSVMETILQVSEGSIDSPSVSTAKCSSEQTQSLPDTTEKGKNAPVFKNYNWIGKTLVTGKRSRVWKSLKQILTSEKQIHGHSATLYSNIDAPPSTRCSKKYSDISGLPAKYTDPLTKLKYSNTKEFRKLRSLAPEIVQGYLSLRKAEVLAQLNMAKKKKSLSITTTSFPSSGMETILQVSEGSIDSSTEKCSSEQAQSLSNMTEKAKNAPVFKNYNWIGKTLVTGKRSRVWKSLKQILTLEKQIHGHSATLYSNIDAPPSTRCSKKYSDISGLPAKYTDPLTKLKYSNTKEFRKLRSLAPEIVQGYFSLRKAQVLAQL